MQELIDQINKNKPFYKKKFFKDLYSWKELENLINLRPFVTTEALTWVNNKHYKWKNGDWTLNPNTYPPSLIQKELKEHMCYLRDASRANKKINNLCHELEEALDCSADAHIFFSLTDKLSDTFRIHFDTNYNLIISIDGKIRFKAWNKKETDPKLNKLDLLDENPLFDIVLESGDCVYIPKHYYHQAIPLTARLSVSIPFNPSVECKKQERHWIDLTCKN